MLRNLTKAIMIAVLLAVPAGCANDGRGPLSQLADLGGVDDNAPLTPAERRLREDSRIYNETILGGVATGAIVGALLGAALGAANGGGRGAARGAAIGATLGGVAGGLDGWRVATRQEASRQRVREIDVATQRVLDENRRMKASLDNMESVIASSRRSVRGARTGYRSGRVSLEEVRRAEARAARNAQVADSVIEDQQARLREQARIADAYRREGRDTRQIDNDIARTQAQLEEARRERDALETDLLQGRIS